MKLTKHSSHIHTIDNFIDAERCDEMIEWSEQKGYQKASVTTPSGPRMMSGARNNDRLIFDYKPLAEELFSTLKVFLPNVDGLSPIELNERFRFYRYDIDQRFKRHRDGRVNIRGQESRLTFMIYLNEGFSGGQTRFDEITITPRKGMALLFTHELKHESLNITKGLKYVLRSDVFYNKSMRI